MKSKVTKAVNSLFLRGRVWEAPPPKWEKKITFTEDQRRFVRDALNKFDPQQVENFIHDAEILFEPASHVVNEQNAIEDYHSLMDDLVKQVEKLKKQTKNLERGMLSAGETFIRNETMKGFECLTPGKWDRLPHNEEIQLIQDAWEATNALEKLSQSLKTVREKNTHPLGRKPADHYGICLNLGYLYFKAFSKMPSTTKGGPFIEVLKVFLQSLNLPCSDPTRLIKLSIPELKRGLEVERQHEESFRKKITKTP